MKLLLISPTASYNKEAKKQRYFVLRIEDGKGKHTFVELGFGERNEAFDFNVALSDHDKYVRREGDKEVSGEGSDEGHIDIHPAVNHRLNCGSSVERSGAIFTHILPDGNHRLKFFMAFVPRIKDRRGKHAFVMLGFKERNEALDFNVALSDHDKYVKRKGEKEIRDEGFIDINPSVNKEGETICINVKNKISAGTGMLSAAGLSGNGKAKPLALYPPPTGGGKIRSPLPPPPNDPAISRIASTSQGVGLKGPKETVRRSTDALSDFSQLEMNLPSTKGSVSINNGAAGWAAF